MNLIQFGAINLAKHLYNFFLKSLAVLKEHNAFVDIGGKAISKIGMIISLHCRYCPDVVEFAANLVIKPSMKPNLLFIDRATMTTLSPIANPSLLKGVELNIDPGLSEKVLLEIKAPRASMTLRNQGVS